MFYIYSIHSERELILFFASDHQELGHIYFTNTSLQQYSIRILTVSSAPSLVTANITVSSISIRLCNHLSGPFSPHLFFNVLMSSFKNINSKQDVGDPCLTSITTTITVRPSKLSVTLYLTASCNHYCTSAEFLQYSYHST